AFHTAPDALDAALEAQRALHREPWPEGAKLRVRMALHSGAVEVRTDDYFGAPLNRVARLLAAGHGGRTPPSPATPDPCPDPPRAHPSPAPAGPKAPGPPRPGAPGPAGGGFQALPPRSPKKLPAAPVAGRSVRQGNAVDRRAAFRQHEPRRRKRILRGRALRR